MKRYPLSSAWYRGKISLKCSLAVDEERNVLTVTGKKGLLKKSEVVLAEVPYDEQTPVSIEEERLRVGDLTIAAESEAAAADIMLIVRNPAEVEARRQREHDLTAAEDGVKRLLAAREECLAELAKVRENARSALIALAPLWTDDSKEPLDQVRVHFSERLSAALSEARSELGSLEAKSGPVVVERIYALACAIGLLQDALFLGRPTEEIASLLSSLGVPAEQLTGLRIEGLADRLVNVSHPRSLSMLTPEPAPREPETEL